MAKKTLYVHEARRGNGRAITFVTYLGRDWHSRSRKKALHDWFMIDEPGTWWDDEWNVHVDGCDYPCKTLEDALCKGVEVLDTPDPVTGERFEYEFRYVVRPFERADTDPKNYDLNLSAPMVVNYSEYQLKQAA